jgi:hypothetical protein
MNTKQSQILTEETMKYLLSCGDVIDVYHEPEEIIHETAEIMACFVNNHFDPIIHRIWEVMPEDKNRKSYGHLYTDWEYLHALLTKVEHFKMAHLRRWHGEDEYF